MMERRTLLRGACLLGLGFGAIPILSGCGESGSDSNTVKPSVEQQEKNAAAAKATEDAFKETHKKKNRR